jgi:molybdopterin/thiamine biosynthesis adenylyltransferase
MKPNILIYPDDLWIAQENHISRKDAESMAFAFVGLNQCDDKNEFLVFDGYLPSNEEFSRRRAYGISLRVDFVCKVLEKVKQCNGLVDIHTHPEGLSHFSSIDNCGHQIQMQNVFDFSPQGVLIRIVKEQDNFRAEVTNTQIRPYFEPVDLIKIIGDKDFQFIYPVNSRLDSVELAEDIAQQHQRTMEFYKKDALSAIRQTHIGIVGLGGNGSAVVNVLKFFSFMKWTLVDADVLEVHNSNRFFGFNQGDAGKYKVDVVKRELQRFDPSVDVETVKSRFPSEEANKALKNCDVLIVAPDNNAVRYAAAQFGMRYLKPLIELGSGITMKDRRVTAIGSQVRFQLPIAQSQCIVCSGLDVKRLESEELIQYKKDIGYITGSNESPGSVVTINNMAASLAAHLLIEYFGNYVNRDSTHLYLAYDEKNLLLTDLSHIYKKNPDCTICGRHIDSIFGKGDILPTNLNVVSPIAEMQSIEENITCLG